MKPGSTLAYLAGLVDGDGYFKITKNYRTPRIVHPYYANVFGVAQLWPGPAVREFARTFGADVKATLTQRGTRMARCELRGRVAASATRKLTPFLLVKRDQAMLFLEAVRLRPTKRGRTPSTERGHERVEVISRALTALQRGEWREAESLPIPTDLVRYAHSTPKELGWTREETLAYLAGIMDSDGNFRIYKKEVPGMRWPHFRINVRCAQVQPSVAISLLAETFGGRITVRRAKSPNCRDLVEWSLHDRTASSAIESLLPYLKVKWVEACLLLELRQAKSRPKEDLTEWEHLTRWQHFALMRKRSHSARQVAEFERIRRRLLELHVREVPPGLASLQRKAE